VDDRIEALQTEGGGHHFELTNLGVPLVIEGLPYQVSRFYTVIVYQAQLTHPGPGQQFCRHCAKSPAANDDHHGRC
jgi:hypothetical protein